MHLQLAEGNMIADLAKLEFVQNMVTNLISDGREKAAMTVMERYGGLKFLEEMSVTATLKDGEAKNMLANLLFIWWRITGDISAQKMALKIWSDIHGHGGEVGIHAAHMLGYITLTDTSATTAEIRERIAQLRVARSQTTADVERTNRMADLAQKLGKKFFRRCE